MASAAGVTVKDISWTLGRYDIIATVDAKDEMSVTALGLESRQGRQCSYGDVARILVGGDVPDLEQGQLTSSGDGRSGLRVL